MRNPWIALDVSTNPVAHARALRRAHERGVGGVSAVRGVRELVVASWRRSLAAGVTPDAPGSTASLSEDELGERRESSPLAGAIGAIFDSLTSLDGDARHVIAVADADANLLWVRGESRAVELAHEMHFEAGAAWSESAAGTNAVGTAAALDHAVQIFSAEHLVTAVHPWTCSAAPIHDPSTGELIGVIDLTSDLRTAHPHTLSLAMLAAQAAEAKLKLDALERQARSNGEIVGSALRTGTGIGRRHRIAPPGQDRPSALLSMQLLGHSARARLADQRHGARARLEDQAHGEERGLRSLELLAVLAMNPDGLTAEELALALYGESGKTVTIRAQVHRIRARLGDGMVHTQPYRLDGQIEADWMEVRRLIAAGRPRDALRAYCGPLLPASDAPAIVEARALLEESLRRSILTSADPALLASWLSHPSGGDDLAAARALVAVLPGGDPRRAAATATLSAIRARMATATAPAPSVERATRLQPLNA